MKSDYKEKKRELKKRLKCEKTNLKTEYKDKKRAKKRQYIEEKRNDKFIYKSRKKEQKSIYREEKKRLKENFDSNLDTLPKIKKVSKRYLKPAPHLGLLEEIGNSVTHGVGAILTIIAFIAMMIYADRGEEYLGGAVYCLGLFAMFTMSCLYHAFKSESHVKNIFRHFDYMCIYLLIGATFAPLLLCVVGGTLGFVFFAIQWAAIATGITLIGVFGPGRLKYIHFPLYFIIGWSGLLFIPQMIKYSIAMFIWIIVGGIFFSIGMIPFGLKKKTSHFIWHFFVLFGAVSQWIGIFTAIYLV